jgi:hypothetical protein
VSFRVVSRTFASSDSAYPQFNAISVAGSIPGSSTRRTAGQGHVEVPHLSAAVPGAGVAALHPKLAVPLRRRQSKSNMWCRKCERASSETTSAAQVKSRDVVYDVVM